MASGRKGPNKETVDKIRRIRDEDGLSYTELAQRFGVSYPTIKVICERKGIYK